MPRACTLVAIIWLALGFGIAFAAGGENAKVGAVEPKIDGRLDDPLWSRAAILNDFVTGDNKAPDRYVTARFVQYGTSLYVGVSIDQKSDTKSSPDDWAAILNGDWIALALDGRGRGFSSRLFLLTADNVRLEGILDGNGSPTPVALLTWRGAAARTASNYSAEFAIPLDELPYVGRGTVQMGMRILRRDSVSGRESQLRPTDPDVSPFYQISLSDLPPSKRQRGAAAHESAQELRQKMHRSGRADLTTLSGRVRAFGDASITDWRLFPASPLKAAPHPFRFVRRLNEAAVAERFAHIDHAPGRKVGDLDQFLDDTDTTALVIIEDGAITYERYLNGHSRKSVFTSFSVAKSFVSTLVGIAVQKGDIGSERDPITKYVPELVARDVRFSQITLADLMHMSSGLAYIEEGDGVRDDQRTYMDPDLRRAALDHARIIAKPGQDWLYNNYNPLLLGLVLERATGQSITRLTQDWIWTPLGMEQDGSWSLDSDASRFEKMESGLNSNPLDFAKLCRLYIAEGVYKGERLLPERWVSLAKQPQKTRPGKDFYGLFWWISPRIEGLSDFYAQGNKGQYVYCSPSTNTIIVRTGIRYGLTSASAWPKLFRRFIDSRKTP